MKILTILQYNEILNLTLKHTYIGINRSGKDDKWVYAKNTERDRQATRSNERSLKFSSAKQ